MAKQILRKRRLEDKLGLNKQEVIKSGFDQETMDIVWDLMNKNLMVYMIIHASRMSRKVLGQIGSTSWSCTMSMLQYGQLRRNT